MRGREYQSVVFLTMVLAACTDPLEVEELVPFDPPAVYQVWWAELELCVGVEGEFDRISWFTAETVRFDGQDTFGVWMSPSTIYLERFYITSVTAVKHEMLHELTDGALPHSHPVFASCTAPRIMVPETDWRRRP